MFILTQYAGFKRGMPAIILRCVSESIISAVLLIWKIVLCLVFVSAEYCVLEFFIIFFYITIYRYYRICDTI